MSRLFINKSFHRNGKKANAALNASANNNTIYEGGESPLQEKNRMNNTVCGAPIKSPPSKFHRNNSNPIPETVSCAPAVEETQKKVEESRQQKSFGKFLRYMRPSSRKKKLPSKHDESFKQYEINSSLLSDELDQSAKMSPLQNIPSQIYEQSINKHGDVVEYAVPYTEQLINELQSPIKIINDCGSSLCEDVTDENVLNESKWNDRLDGIPALGIVSPVKITDLDKSSDGSRSLDQSGKAIIDNNNKEVLSELDSLERWSQNIPQRSLPPQDPPINKSVHVIECKPKEIKPKLSVLRNTIAIPLHFSSGSFRKTPVALRKCCPRDSTSVGLVEEAIERDYDILNKVKHANIILLMAASFHRKSFEHMTLVLEPADYTLNYFLHQMDTTLSIVESISVVQQIASAALYLQECGYIHSNISSHNILVRESPWCVKLSSFELTTEVDFADTRIEILIKYRHKLPSLNSSCADTPKYTATDDPNISLKDQYKQMSKLLPILKCSPNTQHRYLSMMSKHLIYDTNYRQHLSLHNFQAPELLTTKRQFVFPTIKADVYSLCLLLWEMLNKCVPFVVYSKLDMERMIGSNKLSLPFFERERCQPFLDIFRIGLAVNPENRTIDVQQLIDMLEDVKLRIRSGIEDQHDQHVEQCVQSNDIDQVNLYVNATPEACERNEFATASSIFSPKSSDFKHEMLELTSTKKKRKKSPQKFVKKNTFRQLFNSSHEASNISENGSPLSHAQLNDNLDAIASEIRREQSLDEIEEECESLYNSIVGPLLVKENELPSKMLIEKQEPSRSGNTEWRKTSPEIVDFEVGDENHSANSKSCSNLFDASTSESRRRFFHSNITSPPSNGFTIGEFSLPDTPIARQNKIRRNAWLSNKSLNSSHKEADELENQDQPRLDDSNKRNVSIRIVHNKVTPKKVYNGNPSVMSRIKFFDPATETSSIDVPMSNTKITNNDRVDDIDSNYSANYPIKTSTSKEILELASEMRQHPSTDRNTEERIGTFSNCSTLSMSHKNCADGENASSHLGQPGSFENKFWKRELEMCNRSLCSNDTDDDSNVITPKWQSVRDKILNFEKRGELIKKPSSSFTTATEIVRNLSKSVTDSQSNGIKFSEAPTLIKRTIYSESIVSGVDLSSLDNQMPLFDQLNLAGQKLTTQVTLNMRQIRRRSSDLDETSRRKVEEITEIRHTICGSQKGLLTFNVGSSKSGSSCGKNKYICSDCASKMSQDELKALTFESVAESPLNATNVTDHSLLSPIGDCQRTPQRRCQVRVKSQNTRSIEDLYIDDDFDQGLGANIELQSDCSDFLNFDIISDVFNKSDVDA